ncbi:MAG: hypothetical protein E2592_05865 [Methylobacillus sp.]|nr:hypothetical protein [Methylobacillus sp.]
MMTEVIAKNKAGKVNMDELLGPGENPDSADAVDLLNALEGMVYMHKLMMKKTNHGASFYDAECIRSMNVAPMIASQVIARVRAKMEGTVKQ